jgi:hypothetical protein
LPRPEGETVPLSFEQERIFRRERASRGAALPNNECITIRAPYQLDPTLLERSLVEIIRRHEIWRTTYASVDGQAVQRVHETSLGVPLETVDLRSASAQEREARLRDLYARGTRQPFDLARGPLLRATLVTLTNRIQCIVIFAHLSIVDGVTVYQILPSELASIYTAFSSGEPSPFGDLPVQYADYACWQRRWLRTNTLREHLDYWREVLASLPVLPWPTECPASNSNAHDGALQPFTLRQSRDDALKQFSRREGVTLFTTLAAGLGALLFCYTGRTNIVIGIPSLGARKRPEFQALLGHFLNPVPLLIDLRGDPCIRELLLRTQKAVGGAVTHDEIPIQFLAEELRLTTRWERGIFNVGLSLQPPTPAMSSGWQVTSMDADSGGTIFDLYLAFIETPNGLVGRAQYSTHQFTSASITHVLADLQVMFETFTSEPWQRVSVLPRALDRRGLP